MFGFEEVLNMKVKRKRGPGIILILGIGLILFSLYSNIAAGTEKKHYIHVKVQPGDTIWQIAQRNTQSPKDIRCLVYEIREVNNLKSVYILPGQEIKIPAD